MLLKLALLAFSLVIAWFWLCLWYLRLVTRSREQIHYLDGETIPGKTPQLLVGNLVDVYRENNRLDAYHSFHEKFGDIVQIFWLWRQQISIANYRMANRILVANQKNYEKFTPNSLIQRLYGSSVLTNSGDDWKRHRLLMNEVFSRQNVASFHDIFVSYSERLVTKWNCAINESQKSDRLNIYPDLIALFLDIIGQTAIGYNFDALNGKADRFLQDIDCILKQSTCPAHQFARWWKRIPFPSNRKLSRAFTSIDEFLNELIRQKKEDSTQLSNDSYNVLYLIVTSNQYCRRK